MPRNSIRDVQMERSWSRIMFSVSEKMHTHSVQRKKVRLPELSLTHARAARRAFRGLEDTHTLSLFSH